jgi:hypothetical protein
MAIGYCLECDAEIYFRNEPKEGKKLTHPNCNASTVVIGLHPIEPDWIYAEE